jgi:hypothetical protein
MKSNAIKLIGCILFLIMGLCQLIAQGFKGYYQHPDIHQNTIVFVAEGDIWRVPTSGGLAQRLTTHAEEERHPIISPDGTTIAYSATYEGPIEVYTMPLGGESPTRRTYSEGSRVVDWTPDKKIIYSERNKLTDKGVMTAPMHGVYGPEGKWLVEGQGYVPDIEVENLPHETFEGEDAQLEAAIEFLQKKIAEDPRNVPPVPEYPDKSFKNNRKQ